MTDLNNVTEVDENFEEEAEDTIMLVDDDGINAEYEYIDTIDYEGNEYVVFLPVEEDEEGMAEVLILKVEELENEGDAEPDEQYVIVEDEDLLDKLFDIFKKDHGDEFDFAEE